MPLVDHVALCSAGLPHRGALLLSFVVPAEETLVRLAAMQLGGTPYRMPTPGGAAAVVVDPDGVMVELLDRAPSFPLQEPRS